MKPRIPHPLRDPPSNLCDIIKYGYFQQLRLLICSGVQLECVDANRRTPIMLCAFMEPETWGVGTARTLIENGVRLDRKDRFGRNVLHYACIYERFGLIHVLLKAIDFDLNQPDKLGNTALHYAALSGNAAITQIISRFFQRYKINIEKPNKRGRSAVDEAVRMGNTACARVIEPDRNSNSKGSAVVKELHFDQLVSNGVGDVPIPARPSSGAHLTVDGNNRSTLRPASATFLTRPDSTISFASADERRSSCSYRSRSNQGRRGSHRTSFQSPLLTLGIRREDDILPCASEKDFRNTPDFVFKLLHLHFDMQEWNPLHNLDSTNRNSVWTETGSTIQSQPMPVGSRPDWRHELKSLFKVYESQCSSSWRAAPKAASSNASEEQERLDAEEEAERGKKSRRHSSHARPGPAGKEQAAAPMTSPAGPDLRRRPSATRIRRLSSVLGPTGKMLGLTDGTGNLDTSSESVNSSVSSYKKRGPERETNPSGRSENVATRTGMRKSSLEPSLPPSPSSSPIPPPIVVSEQTNSGRRPPHERWTTDIAGKDKPLASQTYNYRPGNGLPKFAPSQTTMNNEKPQILRRSSNDAETTERSKFNTKMAANDKSVNGGSLGFQSNLPIPRVKESLISERRGCFNAEATQLDTNRLWVQNPYEDNDDYLSDDYDDDDDGSFVE